MSQYYKNLRVLVTGGAGFIGPHLITQLLIRGAKITTVDQKPQKPQPGTTYIQADLQDWDQAQFALRQQEIVFHLAAVHGGRGFITAHPADCCQNFAINQNVFRAAHQAGVAKIQFASSACVYPTDFQDKYGSSRLLSETDTWVKGWGKADQEYGWSKLIGEMNLRAYHRQYGLPAAITRYVTVFGPGQDDSHAIPALIRRALRKEDPFLIWGSGRQDRDFTYVEDIVTGTLAAAEKIVDCRAVNLGTGKRYTLDQVAATIFHILGWKPRQIIHDLHQPEGVKTRALSNNLARKLLGWQPHYSLRSGLEDTIQWMSSM